MVAPNVISTLKGIVIMACSSDSVVARGKDDERTCFKSYSCVVASLVDRNHVLVG